MTRNYTETDLIAAVPALTRDGLLRFVRLEVVLPVETEAGSRYREIDVTRITLLCDLAEDFDLHDDAIVIVMSLLDQLHGSRARLAVVLDAVAAENPEVKRRIARLLAG